MFTLSLFKIGQIVKKLQPCFEIQDGGRRHFELDFSTSPIRVAVYVLNLAMTGQILNTWQLFFEIQDGGDRPLELWLLRLFDVAHLF